MGLANSSEVKSQKVGLGWMHCTFSYDVIVTGSRSAALYLREREESKLVRQDRIISNIKQIVDREYFF